MKKRGLTLITRFGGDNRLARSSLSTSTRVIGKIEKGISCVPEPSRRAAQVEIEMDISANGLLSWAGRFALEPSNLAGKKRIGYLPIVDSKIQKLGQSAYVIIGPEGATDFGIVKAEDAMERG